MTDPSLPTEDMQTTPLLERVVEPELLQNVHVQRCSPGRCVLMKKEWKVGAAAIAVLNPWFAGFILGALWYREPDLRKEGIRILAISAGTGILQLLFLKKVGLL